MKQALEQLEARMDVTRELDIYSFANQSERADHASNLAKLNFVLLTGSEKQSHFTLQLYQLTAFVHTNSGLRSNDFPTDLAGQHAKAMLLVKDLVTKVLNRDEEFTVSLRYTDDDF